MLGRGVASLVSDVVWMGWVVALRSVMRGKLILGLTLAFSLFASSVDAKPREFFLVRKCLLETVGGTYSPCARRLYLPSSPGMSDAIIRCRAESSPMGAPRGSL